MSAGLVKPKNIFQVMRAQAERERKTGWAADLLASAHKHSGHYRYGENPEYHGTEYYSLIPLFLRPANTRRLAQTFVDLLPVRLRRRIDVVAAPVTGGALFGHCVAGILDDIRDLKRKGGDIEFVPIHPDEANGHIIRPAWAEEIKGRRVFVVDDLTNTRQTIIRCLDLVVGSGGKVVGAGVIIKLGRGLSIFYGPKLTRLPKLHHIISNRGFKKYPVKVCPMCIAGKPVKSF